MIEASITQLAAMTGFSRKVCKERLEAAEVRFKVEGRSHVYNTKEALPVLYEVNMPDKLDYQEERARLVYHQANKAELEEKQLNGELAPVSEFSNLLEVIFTAFRSKLLALPGRAALEVIALADIHEAEEVLRRYVYEALEEISKQDVQQMKAMQ